MLYTVEIVDTDKEEGEEEVYSNLTRLEAEVLQSYMKKTYRKESEMFLQEKAYI